MLVFWGSRKQLYTISGQWSSFPVIHTDGFGATAAWAGHSICSSARFENSTRALGMLETANKTCQVFQWDWERGKKLHPLPHVRGFIAFPWSFLFSVPVFHPAHRFFAFVNPIYSLQVRWEEDYRKAYLPSILFGRWAKFGPKTAIWYPWNPTELPVWGEFLA